jgi:predicted RNA binding protein YcfA (HicA-like mRNA interferase family)
VVLQPCEEDYALRKNFWFIGSIILMFLIIVVSFWTGIKAIILLEVSDKQMVRYSENKDFEVYITKNAPQGKQNNFIVLLQEKGWEYSDQMGSAHIFNKGDNNIVVTEKIYLGKYILIQIPKNIENLEY